MSRLTYILLIFFLTTASVAPPVIIAESVWNAQELTPADIGAYDFFGEVMNKTKEKIRGLIELCWKELDPDEVTDRIYDECVKPTVEQLERELTQLRLKRLYPKGERLCLQD